MNFVNIMLTTLRGFECGMCGFTSRIDNKINKHVKEFPNCAFSEQSYQYLSTSSQGGNRDEKD